MKLLQTTKAAKKYEIIDKEYAKIDAIKILINEPLEGISLLNQDLHEYFEGSFDNMFYSHISGTVHTCLLDFNFKPSIVIGIEQSLLTDCLPDCHSFRDFILRLAQGNPSSLQLT